MGGWRPLGNPSDLLAPELELVEPLVQPAHGEELR